jgi:alkanesulfonate monooxygenase SsuD/methylene tetrahydromethanopterin reductase-like flavin-dependent oxidoreductase (luciferase family)
VTGRDEREFDATMKATRERIAFYGSTPAYRGVLDAIGVGELQGELNAMSKQGRWQEVGTLVTDDIVDAFGVVGEPDEVADRMLERYGSFVDHTSASFPVSDDDQRRTIIERLRRA